MTQVLVVDGDPLFRDMIQGLLEREGYSVEAVDGVESYRALLKRERFDVIVMALQLPRANAGADLPCKECGSVPVVGLIEGGMRRSATHVCNGIKAVVAKPFWNGELLDALRQVLESPTGKGDR